MEHLYFATKDNDIVTNDDIARIMFLVNGRIADPDDYVEIRGFANRMKGLVKELEHPSVKFLIEHGRKITAVKVYSYIHDCTLREAHDAVERIAEKIERE